MYRDLTNSRRSSAPAAASIDAKSERHSAVTKTVAIRKAADRSAEYSAVTSNFVDSRRVADIPTNSEVPNYLTQRALTNARRRVARATASVKGMLARRADTSDFVVSPRVADIHTNLEVPAKNFQKGVTAKSLLEASRLNAQRLAAVAERNSEITDEIPIDFKVLNDIKLEKDATHKDLTARTAASMDAQLAKQTADTKTVAISSAAERSAVHGAVTSDVVVSRRVADIPTNSEVPNYLTQRELTNARRRVARATASMKAKLARQAENARAGERIVTPDVVSARHAANARMMAEKMVAEKTAIRGAMITRLHGNVEGVAQEEGKLETSQRITAKRSTVASRFNAQRLAGVAERHAARRLAETSKSRRRQLAVFARNRRAARVAGSTDDVLARRAMNAQRTAAKRAAETIEARSTRLAADVRRIAAKRAAEATQINAQRRAAASERQAARIEAYTSEMRAQQLAKHAERRRAARAEEGIDELIARRAMNAQRTAAKRASETPEARATILAANARSTAAKRAAETTQINAQQRAAASERLAARREAETSEMRAQQLAEHAERRIAAQAKEGVDEVIARRARNAQRTAAKRAAIRATETPEARVAKLAAAARRTAEKRATESSKLRAERRKYDKRKKAQKKAANMLDFSAAQRSLVSHLHAAYGLSIHMQGNLTADHLQHFKHDPMVALLAIATDIGIAYVSQQLIASTFKDEETDDEIGKDKVRMSNGGEHALLSSNNGDRQCSGDNSKDLGHMELTFNAASTIDINDISECRPQDLADIDASMFDLSSSAALQYQVGISIIIRLFIHLFESSLAFTVY